MQLDISSLKDNKGKSLDFRFEEEFFPIDLGGRIIRFHKPVVVEGTAANVESGILVECTIEAVVDLKCDRCLGPVETIIDTTATEEFVEAKDAGFQGDQVEKEVYTYNGNTIDISKIVEENILLNVPMKVLCSDDCKGICPDCGTDLNREECECSQEDVDPRMEKLKEWFKE